MTKSSSELRDFAATSITNAAAAAVSEAFSQAGAVWRNVCLLIQPQPTVTNTEFTVSLCVVDANGVEAWTGPQVGVVRTLPSGDKVVDLMIFSTLRSNTFKVALETIPAGGTVSIKYAFGAL